MCAYRTYFAIFLDWGYGERPTVTCCCTFFSVGEVEGRVEGGNGSFLSYFYVCSLREEKEGARRRRGSFLRCSAGKITGEIVEVEIDSFNGLDVVVWELDGNAV